MSTLIKNLNSINNEICLEQQVVDKAKQVEARLKYREVGGLLGPYTTDMGEVRVVYYGTLPKRQEIAFLYKTF